MTGHYILKLNNRCNMNCLFCADSSATRHLPDNELNSILSGLKENRKRFDSLIITGGEPTIYGKLFKVLRYAKYTCKYKKICLVTNGILLSYPTFLDKLIKLGVDSFQISYFALTKEKQDALSRTRNTFDYVNKGIKNAVKSGKEVRINVVINKLNYEYLPEIAEHLIKLKVNSITLAFMNPIGESVKNGKSILAVPFAAVMPFVKLSFEKAKELGFDNLFIENFPLCIAREYMDRISDLRKPEENKDYYNSGKAKTKECSECSYNENCDGIWQGYLKQFGDKELKPVRNEAARTDTPVEKTGGIMVGKRCSNFCFFCHSLKYQSDDAEKTDEKGVIEDLMDYRKKGYTRLEISGNDPIEYEGLIRIVDLSKKLGFENILINTHGRNLCNWNFAKEMIEAGINAFRIPIYGSNAEIHDSATQSQGSFAETIEGIKNIKKINPEAKLMLHTLILQQNKDDLFNILKLALDLGADTFGVGVLHIPNEDYTNYLPIKDLRPYLAGLIEYIAKNNLKNVYFYDIPHCVFGFYNRKIVNSYPPDLGKYSQPKGNVKSHLLNIPTYRLKTKSGICDSCILSEKCDGFLVNDIKKFGIGGLKPIVLKDNLPNKIGEEKPDGVCIKEKDSLFGRYRFEIAGMELGIKRASVFYLKKNEIPHYTGELKSRGYHCEVSDFSYLTKNEITEKINGQTGEGDYSLYVSKDKDACRRLKYLDYYHQFKLREPNGIDSRDIFFEIGDILGYPKCCSEFLLSCHENKEYETLFAESNKSYQDETIYKLLALKKSHNILHQLNNLSISYPSFFNFFVCRYDCRNALAIANKLIGYIKEKYPSEHKSLIADLKTPIIFFSAHRIIYLKSAVKKDDRAYYTGCSVREELLQDLSKDRADEFTKRFKMISDGDSLKIDDDKILVYKAGKIIHSIRKEHKNDGIFIEFA